MAQTKEELLLVDEDLSTAFDDYIISDSESECEVRTRPLNKGKLNHQYRHRSDDREVFIDNNNFICGSSPSTSSTPVRFRSRNSSVRSIQTVDCCMPGAERDGIVFRSELLSRDYDSSSDEEEILREHKLDELHPIDEEIVDEGLRLYLQFLRDEIENSRLNTPTYLHERLPTAHPRNLEALRILANEFASSPQRAWVRRQAESVPLERLDFASFTELLLGLFQEGGVTWERVIVLFFFCTDLSIRALQESLMRTFQHITEWTTTFISDNFSRWVSLNGGWTEIFQASISQASRVAFFGFCCVGILAFCIFIRNSSKG